MASPTMHPVEKVEKVEPSVGNNDIVIDPTADTIITVTEKGGGRSARFKVVREKLESQSPYFKALFSPNFREGRTNVYELEEDTGSTVITLKLLFYCMHTIMRDALTQLPQELYEIPIEEVWRVLTLVDINAVEHHHPGKYGVPWKQVLYPAYVLSSSGTTGFSIVTKRLVYNAIGQIEEWSPLNDDDPSCLSAGYYQDMHLPKAIMRQLRLAKSFLRQEFEDHITNILEVFCAARCRCRISAFFNFIKALEATNVYPFETSTRIPLRQMLTRFKSFKYEAPKGAETCKTCQSTALIQGIQSKINSIDNMFGGLCLDCLYHSIHDKTQQDLHQSIKGANAAENSDEDNIRCCDWHSKTTWFYSNLK
ncbi:hypothetical protein F4779DRAFT_633128 [Xylariaceae sp. FL0662B]|nr:hypothetical protein F4779DRAFT_633128 [Xylariaceae sp. FL0662B]